MLSNTGPKVSKDVGLRTSSAQQRGSYIWYERGYNDNSECRWEVILSGARSVVEETAATMAGDEGTPVIFSCWPHAAVTWFVDTQGGPARA